MKLSLISRMFAGAKCLLTLVIMLAAMTLPAADLNLKIQLIWGTDDPTSPNAKHTPVDAETSNRFRKVFKWKNYFDVCHQTGVVPARQCKRFRVSPRCEIEVTQLEATKVEVKLIGEGKPVRRIVETLTKTEALTIAADDDKSNSAWFILITLLDPPKPGESAAPK